MSKPKKKRTKAYRPKAVRPPRRLMAKLAPDLTESERTHLDLVGLLALDAIRRGVGDLEHVNGVRMLLQQGFILSAAFQEDEDREGEIKSLMYVALGGLMIAEAFIRDGHPEGVKHWMIDAAQAALELEADMEAALPTEDLIVAAHVVIDHTKKLMPLHYSNIAVLEPGHPETWAKVKDKTGICYLHNSAITGVIDERGEHVYWWNPETDTSIRIEEPAVMVVANDLPPDWRKRHERTHEKACAGETVRPF